MTSPSPFYSAPLPSPNDLVVVEIARIDPAMGVWTQLLEYGGVQGFLSTKEITTKRLLRISDHLKVGAIEVMCVAATDGDAIDLTRKHIESAEAEDVMTRFKLTRSIRQWLDHCDIGTAEERDALRDAIRTLGYKEALASNATELLAAANEHLNLQEKPQIHVREFTFPPTHPMRSQGHIRHLNAHVEAIKAAHPVEITVTDSREGRYLFTSREKILADEFETMFGTAVAHPWSDTELPTPAPEVLPTNHVNVQPTVNVGLIGHVAHGKTSITQVISGVDTRRHKREIMTNRTLKLGYTNARITRCVCVPTEPAYLSGATCACPSVHLSIIDCPGHNVLLSTMISGTHLMDTCLLVVAANEECPQFQTREHMDIVHIVNKATNVVCLQNKVDLLDDAGLQASRAQITKFLSDTGLDTHAVIPVSAQKEVNTDLLLEYLYEWVSRHGAAAMAKHTDAANMSTGVVVRTFDITRPGDAAVKGLVLGGSILSGSFALGDEIVLMPQGIRTHILSLKSDKHALSVAVAGGLIAVGTDLNPCLADSLVGTTIIHARDFQPEQLVTDEFHIYYRGLNKHSYPKRGDKVLLNVLANEVAATVRKVSKDDKHSIRLTLEKPLYIHASDVKFTVCQSGRLIGYGCPWEGRAAAATQPTRMFDIPHIPAYDDLVMRAREQLTEFTVHRTTLPAPVVEFANKYTTIVNFGTLCEILKAPHSEAGEYLRSELGLESWSVNKRNQLLMRGCTNMQRVMSVLRKYANKRMCSKCRSLDTEMCMDRGVKKQRCGVCGWLELPKEM